MLVPTSIKFKGFKFSFLITSMLILDFESEKNVFLLINFDWVSFNNLHIEGNNWWIIGSSVCKGKRKDSKLCAVNAQKDTYASVNGSSNAF